MRVVLRDGRRATYGRRVGATRGFARPHAGGRGAGNRDVRRRRLGWRARVGVALMTSGAVLAGCTATEAIREVIPTPRLGAPADPATVLAPTAPVPLAVAASAALYTSAPVVVLAADGDAGGQAGAASAAVALGAPMLLTPGASADPADATAVTGEVARLGPQALLAVGQGAQEWAAQKAGGPRVVPAAPEALAGLIKVDVRSARAVDPNALTDAVGGLDRAKPELLTVAAATVTPPAPRPPARSAPSPQAVPDLPVDHSCATPRRAGRAGTLRQRPGRPAGHRPCRRGAGGRAADAGPPRERHPHHDAVVRPAGEGAGAGRRLRDRRPARAAARRRPHRRSAARRRPARVPRPADGRPLRHPGHRRARLPGRAGPQRLDRARQEPRRAVPAALRRAGRPGLRDHHDGRGRTAGCRRRLLERGRDRQDPALRRRREGRGRLRDARPAAGPHRLPHPGQALPGAARGAARRPRARPGVAAGSRDRCTACRSGR